MSLLTCPECSNAVSDKAANCPRCGHPVKPVVPQTRADLDALILQMLAQGNKIAAMKIYEDYTSAGSDDAKRYVEDLEASLPIGTDPTPPPWMKPSPPHTSPVAIFRGLLFLAALGFVVIFGARWIWRDAVSRASSPVSQTSPNAESSLSSSFTPVSDISWSEVDGIYNSKSKETDLRKDETWKRYKGKKVR